MFKIIRNEAPNYLINLIPKCEHTIKTRNSHKPLYHCRTECFKSSFFPSALSDWFNLDENIRSSESISVFKKKITVIHSPNPKQHI